MDNIGSESISFWKEKSKKFVDELYSESLKEKAISFERPLVTLTYAQSLDGKIAGPDKKAIPISSEPSFVMTHYIRNSNHGILVGIGTILNENPRLTTRYSYSSTEANQPIPVVLDSQLRIPLESNILEQGRNPIIFCLDLGPGKSQSKKKQLEALGAQVYECPNISGHVSIEYCLKVLFKCGIKSLMVEGGAQIIQAFIESIQENSSMVDLLIVTVAPCYIGASGTPLLAPANSASSNALPNFTSSNYQVSYSQFGPDIVLATTIS
ncbi:2,5-diamino-6-(ribosylamino)-4(3H)-pyrimidinone 5'-phosphate reductase [Entomophthora muscae]|uniref:2,5-diamino-6-(Ribosylamino)-4(3H)-pyrimidinone 5'-phosphate reductase n=1 Tax=Entomophthora muscae TaxID=34485 RepID=A0ACC2TNM6_9FUNG|nr:2,5-diamino-6-(ribosylamino)-4(3H)-pyrimidinone 5'-phosphate reductase [Entomophthora muscae]